MVLFSFKYKSVFYLQINVTKDTNRINRKFLPPIVAYTYICLRKKQQN